MSPEVDDTPVERSAKVLVWTALALLVVPGLVGFDLWPLTGWRLFSLARGDEQEAWVLDAVGPDQAAAEVDLEALPLPYRSAPWVLPRLRDASEARREEVCLAMLDAVVERWPDTRSVRVVLDLQSQVREEGEWVVTHDREVVHECQVGDSP